MITATSHLTSAQARDFVERRFIAAVIKDPTGERLQECRRLPCRAFESTEAGQVWRTLLDAATFEEAARAPHVRGFFAHPTTGIDYERDRDEVFLGWLRSEGLAFLPQWVAALPATKTRADLKSRRFNHAIVPPEAVPRFLINGQAVCTPGNLTNVIAQAKAGKTAVVGAALAAAICADFGETGRDTLGLTATAPGPRRLLHFDTEQSPYDHDQLVRRALRRAGVDEPPAWLDSYGLAGYSAVELRRALTLTMREAHALGGVFAVIIDGAADLVVDVNDAAECNAFVAELHALAIAHDCPILNIVHENPGQDFGKMRGHLGSQLERKAESNLRLRKAEEETVIFSEKMRRAPIREKDGPRFRWSDGAGMHVLCATTHRSKEDAKRDRLFDRAEAAFALLGKSQMKWQELRGAVEKTEGISPSGAAKRIDVMKDYGVLKKDGFGNWLLAS